MKKNIFIHVGFHKTGTTSIQVALTQRREFLSKLNYLYPHAGVPDWAKFGHHLLPWSVFEIEDNLPSLHGYRATFSQSKKRDIWNRLRQEIARSDSENVILSSEEFDVCSAAEIENVARQLKGYNIKPVVFVRNLPDLIESLYNTTVVHSSGNRPFVDFQKNQRSRLDVAQFVEDWASVSSDGKVTVLNYDDPMVRRNSVRAFLNAIGIDSSDMNLVSDSRYNESLPIFATELIIHLHQKGVGEDEINRFIDNLRKIDFKDEAFRNYTLYSNNSRIELDRKYLEEIEKLRSADYVQGLSDQVNNNNDRMDKAYVGNHVHAMLALVREISTSKDVQPLPRR
ncbi:hypothetical protein [Sphingobium abikonense]|uniref:hypothetical protein n=1 Tax=Sphingobium abikonense TaxID=86193 RepID=UPI000B30F2E2|nr:hypothetical protein [Sphingobium abikonense]